MKKVKPKRQDKPSVTLNKFLVIKQGLTESDINKIMKLHEIRLEKVAAMKNLNSSDLAALRELRDEITEIDFQLQDLWKFGRNINYHRFFELPHCTCPRFDNLERIGLAEKIVDADCPIHGT